MKTTQIWQVRRNVRIKHTMLDSRARVVAAVALPRRAAGDQQRNHGWAPDGWSGRQRDAFDQAVLLTSHQQQRERSQTDDQNKHGPPMSMEA